ASSCHHGGRGGGASPFLHQHRNAGAVHGRATLAVTATRGRGLGSRQGEITDSSRYAAVQEPEPVAVTPIFGALDDCPIVEADRLRFDLLDLEAIVASGVICAIAALALAQQ